MRKFRLNRNVGLILALMLSAILCPTEAMAAVKNIMCVKTNTGHYFPVVRVSMMVVPDGANTFEILLKDGEGEANVESISFEKHDEEIDFNKYKVNSDGTSYIDVSKKIYLITNTGKYFSLGTSKPQLVTKDGSSLFDVVSGNEVVAENVADVFFYRGDNPEKADGIEEQIIEEKLTLRTPISSQMTISGCGEAKKAFVYDINGRKVAEAAVSNGASTIVVSDFSAGVYIVKVGRKSLKFVKK